jgi:hypothetical protein
VDIVVGTPGRVIDHINRGTLKMDQLRTVVLDEADEMLDMGFAEDIEAILEAAPADRQTVLFSATIPSRIDKLARKYLRSPIRIEIRRRARRPARRPRCGRARTSSPGRTSRRCSDGCWTSRRRRRRSSSAAPARRWTASPRRSTAAATGPRRCTAGSARSSATR